MSKTTPIWVLGLLTSCSVLAVVMFSGLSASAATFANDEVKDNSILCQGGGGGTVYHIVVGPNVLGNLTSADLTDSLTDDPCGFFFYRNNGSIGAVFFGRVGTCGESDLIGHFCNEYGRRITADDLPVWDEVEYRDSLSDCLDDLFMSSAERVADDEGRESVVSLKAMNPVGSCGPNAIRYEAQ